MDVHGSLCRVHSTGVLLRGEPGAGKSWQCLHLLERGHGLVADDCVILSSQHQALQGQSPSAHKPQLALRGVGIVDVQQAFGPKAWTAQAQTIGWLVELQHSPPQCTIPELRFTEVLGHAIPTLHLPTGANHSAVIELCCRLGPERLQAWKRTP
nr:hypothetical protein [Oceanococcus sp. HetDA_MAG_MS8]